MFYNKDCIKGSPEYLKDESVDLLITDPPYGISGDKLHKHYNRNEEFVLNDYIEIPINKYAKFSEDWIKEAERVLKPGGSIYVVSGYTNLRHILNALSLTKLKEVNHIIWKYNFGVYTKKKFISSHYHLLFYVKPGGNHTFNTFSRYSDSEKLEGGGSLNYKDREDVWVINREYKPGKIKNKNELPTELLKKIILYSSNPKDLICDFFLGSFSTAKVALGLGRNATGFEKSKTAFNYQKSEIKKIKFGELLKTIRRPSQNLLKRQGMPLGNLERKKIVFEYKKYREKGLNKKETIEKLTIQIGRGYWSILKIIDGTTNKSLKKNNILKLL